MSTCLYWSDGTPIVGPDGSPRVFSSEAAAKGWLKRQEKRASQQHISPSLKGRMKVKNAIGSDRTVLTAVTSGKVFYCVKGTT